MTTQFLSTVRVSLLILSFACGLARPASAAEEPVAATTSPAAFDMAKAKAEIEAHYSKAHPEVQEYILWTAKQFGPSGMWFNEDAFANLTGDARDKKIVYLAALLQDGEYGRHLCNGVAEAGALKDPRLIPGLTKVAGYHRDDIDYDCRAKWMAVAALARQESPDAVPLLVSLVDHGNQNTRMWAQAALARITGQNFKQDKLAWADWWKSQGHNAIDDALLAPYKAPDATKN